MSFAGAQERLQQAVFDRLGEDATWSGIADPVRVIRREADEDLRLGEGSVMVTGRSIRVRKAQVAAPAEGDTAQILDAAGAAAAGALYSVAGEPKLDRKGVWHCPVEPG